ncbi:MAG: hypothetical protein HKN82_05610 [Akkermansiaceae bacterium]|nr:hypothetical protein [Akkermansiaceae bacterium]NNM28334.1 hypothetical protein [Akkermansiaceae bacterium]
MTTASLVHRDDPDPAAWPPVWKVWANPIIRRYARSRLRVRGLSVGILLTLLVAGFLFFSIREGTLHRGGLEAVDANRTVLIPLLILQGIILFLLGTGQVAGAMTAEADEGVIEYQRLAPMSPLSKVIGYLFGLPIREYVLCAVTMPFSIWALWRGEVPLGIGLQLYTVFFSSAILYHLTGLVAGTVVKNRRWAFLASMGLVFLLYTVMPQLANFGLVFFRYLTLLPVAGECYPYMLPRDAGAVALAAQNLLPSARFFNLDLPQAAFTLLSQGVLILTGLVMLWRRWRKAESHLLGKAWATGLFGWIQLVLLGNSLPLIDPGYLFPSRELNRFTGRFQMSGDWKPELVEAVVMTGLFGLTSLLMMWVITSMITPNAEGRLRGWRRTRKLGRQRLSPLSDPATGFWWILVMVAMAAAGWFIFTNAVVGSHWFPGYALPPHALGAFLLVMATGGLGFHALLESRGGRFVGLVVIVVGVVPIMAGTIVALISDLLAVPATWLIAISPWMAPFYAAAILIPLPDMPVDLVRAMPRAFWFWQATGALVTLRLIAGLRQALRKVAVQAAEDEGTS